MKRAKASAQTVEITCPYCEEIIVEPDSGSLYWAVIEINTPTITCQGCGKESLAPKVR